jgi:hypothetical protein
MARCAACNSTILFGGKRDANGQFCNQKCQASGALLAATKDIPETTVREQVWQIHQGLKPQVRGCRSRGRTCHASRLVGRVPYLVEKHT